MLISKRSWRKAESRSLFRTLCEAAWGDGRPAPQTRRRLLRMETLEERTVLTITWNIIPLAAGVVVGDGDDDMPGTPDDEVTIALPADVQAAFLEATRLWDLFISDDITVNVEVGWGVNFASNLNAFANSPAVTQTYTAVRNALAGDATSADDNTAVASLTMNADVDMLINWTSDNPNGSGSGTPYLDDDGDANNTTVQVKRANAKALGLIAANDAMVDGRIVFNSTRTWDFDRSDGVSGFDLVGIAAHEIGHFLGFTSGVDVVDANDGQDGRPGPFADSAFDNLTVLDLFRFSTLSVSTGGVGTIDFTADGRDKFFSIDGGNTALGNFSEGRNNGTPSRQASHWSDLTPEIGIMDPTTNSGEFDYITRLDLRALDVIGWDLITTALAPDPVLSGTAAGDDILVNLNPSDTTQTQIVINGTVVATYTTSEINTLTIDGLAGDDKLTIDYSNGNPLPTGGLTFNGGADSDSLEIRSGVFTTITNNFTNANDGNIVLVNTLLASRTVTYTSLAPVLINVGSVNDMIFNLPAGVANNGVILGDDSAALAGISQLSGPTFEDTAFRNPLSSLVINGGNSGNTITVQALDAGFNANTVITGGSAVDDITFLTNTGLTNAWTVNGGGGNDRITIEYAATPSFTSAVDGTITSLTGLPPVDFTSVETIRIVGDYGDGPLTYGTRFSATSEAAYHGNSALRLGAYRDNEFNGLNSPNAQGDDGTNLDDEDGVTFASALIAHFGAKFTVTASGAGFIDAWIDFNRNGVFDADEQIAASVPVVAGANELVVPEVPATAVAGTTFARFRISSAGGLTPTSGAVDGEVEDYAVQIVVPAPNSVTLLEDPENPGTTLLLANGTSQSDAIVVQPVPGNPSQHQVIIAPFPPSFFSPINPAAYDRIVVFGNDGNDSIVIDPSITKPTALYGDAGHDSIVGGSGNDRIYGGEGNDVLVGGAGADALLGGGGIDYLYGGLGNDLLIGGSDTDFLFGQENDDLEIGGSTTSDGNFAALEAILAIWGSAQPFNTRVALLAGSLNAGTVFDDGATDYLTGHSGQDWFLDFALADLVLDFSNFDGDRRN